MHENLGEDDQGASERKTESGWGNRGPPKVFGILVKCFLILEIGLSSSLRNHAKPGLYAHAAARETGVKSRGERKSDFFNKLEVFITAGHAKPERY